MQAVVCLRACIDCIKYMYSFRSSFGCVHSCQKNILHFFLKVLMLHFVCLYYHLRFIESTFFFESESVSGLAKKYMPHYFMLCFKDYFM